MNVQSDIIKIKENRKHGTALVPFSLYECPMPELFTHVLTHWHEEFLDCIRQILSAARENKGHSDLLLKSGLFRFLYLLEKGASLNPEAESFERDLIRPSLRYMEEHYGENVTICQLAGCCNLSKSYFMSCFKKATGISAMEHLIQLRIRAACETLHKTDRNISDIAANCGYSNLSNFNRQFKRYVGCSPGNYRKMGNNSGKSR